MALITEEIYSQAFELIRDRIAEILIEELEGQVINFYRDDLSCEIFVERNVPIDKTELSVINVSFAGGSLQQENIKDGMFQYTYNVDVYTNSKTNALNTADNRAAVKGQKLIGACRSILKNPVYKTLAFAPGEFVSRVSISQTSIADTRAQDANADYMGRLTVLINATEITSYINPRNIDGYTTVYKISDGNKGYKYTE